jgi:benzodiazapine receptor
MGYASHLNVKALDRTPPGLGRTRAMRGMKLYYAQLFLNQIWTPLFFGAGESVQLER